MLPLVLILLALVALRCLHENLGAVLFFAQSKKSDSTETELFTKTINIQKTTFTQWMDSAARSWMCYGICEKLKRMGRKICLPDFLNSRELLILDMIRVKFLSLIWRVISSVVFDISCTSRQAVSFLQEDEREVEGNDFIIIDMTRRHSKWTGMSIQKREKIEQCQQHLIFLFTWEHRHWIKWHPLCFCVAIPATDGRKLHDSVEIHYRNALTLFVE